MEGGCFCFRDEEMEALGGWGVLGLHSCWGSLGSTPGLCNPHPVPSSLSGRCCQDWGPCGESEPAPRGPSSSCWAVGGWSPGAGPRPLPTCTFPWPAPLCSLLVAQCAHIRRWLLCPRLSSVAEPSGNSGLVFIFAHISSPISHPYSAQCGPRSYGGGIWVPNVERLSTP